jgi:hypothetical protein
MTEKTKISDNHALGGNAVLCISAVYGPLFGAAPLVSIWAISSLLANGPANAAFVVLLTTVWAYVIGTIPALIGGGCAQSYVNRHGHMPYRIAGLIGVASGGGVGLFIGVLLVALNTQSSWRDGLLVMLALSCVLACFGLVASFGCARLIQNRMTQSAPSNSN